MYCYEIFTVDTIIRFLHKRDFKLLTFKFYSSRKEIGFVYIYSTMSSDESCRYPFLVILYLDLFISLVLLFSMYEWMTAKLKTNWFFLKSFEFKVLINWVTTNYNEMKIESFRKKKYPNTKLKWKLSHSKKKPPAKDNYNNVEEKIKFLTRRNNERLK